MSQVILQMENQSTKKGKEKVTEVDEALNGKKVDGLIDKDKGKAFDSGTMSIVEAPDVVEYVDISFDSERTYLSELGNNWKIVNNDDIHHEIVFNEDEDLPLVVSGWKEIEEFYGLPNHVFVVMSYYANNTSEVATHTEVTSYEELPRFHSRFFDQIWIFIFHVEISPNTMSGRKLVGF
ncbi:hypothetical protein RYX36_023217 [Vicia faba]